jgi:transposase
MCIETRSPTRRCDLQLRLLLADEPPESWIPPAPILELRTLVRMRKALIDQRSAWQQRIHAQLFHQGVPAGLTLRTQAGRGDATAGGASTGRA